MYIYTCQKKNLYAKHIYCDYPNENVEHPDLRIAKIWFQKKNQSNATTFTTFSQ